MKFGEFLYEKITNTEIMCILMIWKYRTKKFETEWNYENIVAKLNSDKKFQPRNDA